MNDLLSDYAEQHKSNRVIKRKKFSYKTCDFSGLALDITKKLITEDLDQIGTSALCWQAYKVDRTLMSNQEKRSVSAIHKSNNSL